MSTAPDDTFNRQHHIPEDEGHERLQQLALTVLIILLIIAIGRSL